MIRSRSALSAGGLRHYLGLGITVTLGAALAFLSGCEKKEEAPPAPTAQSATPKEATPAPKPAATVDRSLLAAFSVLPARMVSPTAPITDDQIALGKQLYFENRISKG